MSRRRARAVKGSASVAGCAALVTMGACAAPAPGPAVAWHPDWQEQCLAGPSGLRPLILEWPAADRAALDARARTGAVVVHAEGCKVDVLAACRLSGRDAYGYFPTTRKRQTEKVATGGELFATFPVGAATLAARLSPGQSLDVTLDIVGTWATPRTVFGKAELTGDCAGATHVLTSLTAGAYTLDATSGVTAEAHASVAALGPAGEVGASATHGTAHLASDGDDAACAQATSHDTGPPTGCGALLRVVLAPLREGSVAAESCAHGTRWDGTACVAREDLACPAGTHFVVARGCVVDRLEGAIAPAVVAIPPAEVVIGSKAYPPNEVPAHKVAIAAFAMDTTEVTVEAYKLCVDAGRCTPPGVSAGCTYPFKRRAPVNCVDFNQAVTYCGFRSERLPTEEEWEYAARGPVPREYPWGDEVPFAFGPDPAGEKACWKRLDPHTRDVQGACPVASYPSDRSPFGMLDAAGNVAEWTASPYCAYSDPHCVGSERVVRGGFWATSTARDLRASARSHALPAESSDRIGFRCAEGP
jgi:formylglycine-generating enzyme required for sulfatase activity